MRTKLKWSPGPGVKILGITLQDEANWVVSAAAKPVGICPYCGARSRHRHGSHNRRLQDLPVQGQVVKINLALNRWQCRHRKCGRRTFIDRLPEIASPYMRRTERMAEIVALIGHRMGGRPGDYLMHRLGMPVSDDTILRQLKRKNPVSRQKDNTRFVGIDGGAGGIPRGTARSWSISSVIRSSMFWTTAASRAQRAWLQERPTIKVVSRVRCGLYAQPAREGAPQARQVADPFHLVQNLRATIKE